MPRMAIAITILILATSGIAAARQAPDNSSENQAAPPPQLKAPTARWVPDLPGPWNAELRLARSPDGLTFTTIDKPVFRFADAPTLARLPDNRLLAVFKHYSRSQRRHFGSLGCTISSDEGKTWSPVKPVMIDGLNRRSGPPGGPVLVVRPDEPVRLVFVCKDAKGRRATYVAEMTEESGPKPVQRPRFKVTGRLRLAEKQPVVDDLVVLYVDKTCHLFGTLPDVAGKRYHGISKTGRKFKRLDNVHVADVGREGCAVSAGDGYRFYGTCPAGIMSATSTDGAAWTREEGLRFVGGQDPAVIKLRKDGYLMLYVKPPPGARGRDRRESSSEQDAETHWIEVEGIEQPSEVDEAFADQAVLDAWYDAEELALADAREAAIESLKSGEEADEDEAFYGSDEAMTPEELEEELWAKDGEEEEEWLPPDEEAYENDVEGRDSTDGWSDFECTEDGVPLPDFVHPVNYRTWFEQRHDPGLVEDNAYDYYAALMFGPDGGHRTGHVIPHFVNMGSDQSNTSPPGPWHPDERPAWEQSYHEAADLTARFAEAASHRNYVRQPLFSLPGDTRPDAISEGDDRSTDPELRNLLLNALLPDLSAHRMLVKQTMSDAWRAPDGVVDPQAMIDSLDTCLSSGGHIAEGEFLIESLMGVAIKMFVETHARQALVHEVFDADELELALEVFIEKDTPLPDPGGWVSGEVAASLDVTQYLYGPYEDGREPKLDPERFERLHKWFGTDSEPVPQLSAEEIESSDPRATADKFVGYYREVGEKMRIGYPDHKRAEFDALAKSYTDDKITEMLVPSLGRAHQIATRYEASRRATQLTYAIHLHKARTGAWPGSLDDLPPRYTETARTDPFSGADFAYRVTDDGPLLYSTSENGADDGGVHHSRWNDEETDNGDDYVFWPPKHRE
ncbi:MAG: hypothetical protein ABII12_01940 [Planctomycetota bacterium]